MAQYFEVHPQNPQPRLLKQAVGLLQQGGVLAVPTDSSYALVCHLDDKAAADCLRRIRGVDDKHHLTLLCRDLSELANYAKVDNAQFRLIKYATPGPYTFILPASKEVPRRVSHPQRKTIGLKRRNRIGRGNAATVEQRAKSALGERREHQKPGAGPQNAKGLTDRRVPIGLGHRRQQAAGVVDDRDVKGLGIKRQLCGWRYFDLDEDARLLRALSDACRCGIVGDDRHRAARKPDERGHCSEPSAVGTADLNDPVPESGARHADDQLVRVALLTRRHHRALMI